MEQLQKIVKAVQEMRKLQTEYLETRSFIVLGKKKKQENYVDRLISEINQNG